ncbi:TPA: helix-turn-helix domain-containing protein [Streptococcus pneumoniae]|uniref:S24 family peptidase n=1 Tax=Streptococcus pneumoniae TaxID=1313 RepID=UPI0002311F13|nr:S24 family peptidase [Streptococcus pneumoniae]EHE04834.1 helix-turn-helix family protein [Streptococcus pneumoniae GA16242]MDS2335837.1 S24 family peptidase [Streptococcus pneumoniae]MDS2402782.1 S24 family peptidase [Streptococcus pneumoniae]MDS2566035.1 S24 family peptidase [Streptococcus pneumoniae]MDS2627919.1 S24 family peptidase [Streptococcus pneumoniae]
MDSLAQNIKYYRKLSGLTQKELAKKLSVAPTAISAWEVGRNQPLMNNIEQMSAIFGIKKSLLLGEDFSSHVDKATSPIQTIYDQLKPPRQAKVLNYAKRQLDEQKNEEETKINEVSENIIRLDDYRQTTYRRVTGVVSAGSGSMQDDDLDMEVSFYEDEIPDDYDAIAYVVGNSMEPKIKNGDYLFIKNTPQVDYNTIGIFQVDGANYVKKLRQGYLESLNPDYEDIHLDENNDIRTIGKVVSVYREK